MEYLESKERARLKSNRNYFEEGCACIHKDKTLPPCPAEMSDADAVEFYEQNCKCSRNYIHDVG